MQVFTLFDYSESFNIFMFICLLDLIAFSSTLTSFFVPNDGLENLFLKLNPDIFKLDLIFFLSVLCILLLVLIFLTEFLSKKLSFSLSEMFFFPTVNTINIHIFIDFLFTTFKYLSKFKIF